MYSAARVSPQPTKLDSRDSLVHREVGRGVLGDGLARAEDADDLVGEEEDEQADDQSNDEADDRPVERRSPPVLEVVRADSLGHQHLGADAGPDRDGRQQP